MTVLPVRNDSVTSAQLPYYLYTVIVLSVHDDCVHYDRCVYWPCASQISADLYWCKQYQCDLLTDTITQSTHCTYSISSYLSHLLHQLCVLLSTMPNLYLQYISVFMDRSGALKSGTIVCDDFTVVSD